jgi:hypothetical protein
MQNKMQADVCLCPRHDFPLAPLLCTLSLVSPSFLRRTPFHLIIVQHNESYNRVVVACHVFRE